MNHLLRRLNLSANSLNIPRDPEHSISASSIFGSGDGGNPRCDSLANRITDSVLLEALL